MVVSLGATLAMVESPRSVVKELVESAVVSLNLMAPEAGDVGMEEGPSLDHF